MERDEKILVISTREKHWWWSMQEIIPAIERIWTRIGASEPVSVETLFAPLSPEVEPKIRESASQIGRIVIISTTPETVKIALLLRQQMGLTSPFIVYVSGDSTEGFHAFGGLVDVLTESDIFVVSCAAEAIATRHSFPDAKVRVIPFPLVDQFKVSDGVSGAHSRTAPLAYIGRVSEQKNLHTLLFALWIINTFYPTSPKIELDVYGSEDNLGSPNMGICSSDYGQYLKRTTKILDLEEVVHWHGFKDRSWLFDNVHLRPHVFVSPTLHSDENFGSSVLASLTNGHQVVTTAWGGHFGFKNCFPEQLTLVRVNRSTRGPVVDPFGLAIAIKDARESASTPLDEMAFAQALEQFSGCAVTARTVKMLYEPITTSVPLEKSQTQEHLDRVRACFGGTRKIYRDYEDPVAQIFFEAYGMKGTLTFEEHSSYILVPWISIRGSTLCISDPHRGELALDLDESADRMLEVAICPSLDSQYLPETQVKRLVALGYAFAMPLRDSAQIPTG